MKTILLKINQSLFEFSLLKGEDEWIEAHLQLPLTQQELASKILLKAQKYWNEHIENCCYAFQKANNDDYHISEHIKSFDSYQSNDLIHIFGKPNYLMGSSQVRKLQHALDRLLTPSEYVSINKILIPYEKILSRSANREGTALEFYYSLSPQSK